MIVSSSCPQGTYGTTGALASAGLAGYNLIHSVVKCCHETVLKTLAGGEAESRGEPCPRSRRLIRGRRQRGRHRPRHLFPWRAAISVPFSAEWTGTRTPSFPKRPARASTSA